MINSSIQQLLGKDLKSIQWILDRFVDSAQLLENHKSYIVKHWTLLYLNVFGRQSYFSGQRVTRIFDELTTDFLKALKKSDLNEYIEKLRESGKTFCQMGVPFEEVVVCTHLFLEACIEVLKTNVAESKQFNPEEMSIIYNELGRIGSAIFSLSYFNSIQDQWQKTAQSYQDESEKANNKLKEMEQTIQHRTKSNITQMDHVLGRINRKLYQGRSRLQRLHKFWRRLVHSRDILESLRMTNIFLYKNLPRDTEILFALFDDGGQKLYVYGPSLTGFDTAETFGLSSEVPRTAVFHECLDWLENPATPWVLRQGVRDEPQWIFRPSCMSQVIEFMMIPLRSHDKFLGFAWIASAQMGVLSQGLARYFKQLIDMTALKLFALNRLSNTDRQAVLVASENRGAGAQKWTVDAQKPLEQQMDECLGQAIEAIGVERASIMVPDHKRKLQVSMAKGLRVYPFSNLRLKKGEGIAGMAFAENRAICLSALSPTHNAEQDLKSLACFPIVYNGEPIGVLNMSTVSYSKIFQRIDVEIAKSYTDRFSILIPLLNSVLA